MGKAGYSGLLVSFFAVLVVMSVVFKTSMSYKTVALSKSKVSLRGRISANRNISPVSVRGDTAGKKASMLEHTNENAVDILKLNPLPDRAIVIARYDVPNAEKPVWICNYPAGSLSNTKESIPAQESFNRLIEDVWAKTTTSEPRYVVDIGGNIGKFALHAAAKGFIVHTYEPIPANQFFLHMGKHMNGFENMVIHDVAVSHKQGKLAMTVPKNFGFRDSSSAVRSAVKQDVTEEYVTQTELRGDIESMGNTDIDILKVDVQGFEGAVITGVGSDLLCSKRIKHVFMEWCPEWMKSAANADPDIWSPQFVFDEFLKCGYKAYRDYGGAEITEHSSLGGSCLDIYFKA